MTRWRPRRVGMGALPSARTRGKWTEMAHLGLGVATAQVNKVLPAEHETSNKRVRRFRSAPWASRTSYQHHAWWNAMSPIAFWSSWLLRKARWDIAHHPLSVLRCVGESGLCRYQLGRATSRQRGSARQVSNNWKVGWNAMSPSRLLGVGRSAMGTSRSTFSRSGVAARRRPGRSPAAMRRRARRGPTNGSGA
jgi:hypothetical protein